MRVGSKGMEMLGYQDTPAPRETVRPRVGLWEMGADEGDWFGQVFYREDDGSY